jgi:hypothetical protein
MGRWSQLRPGIGKDQLLHNGAQGRRPAQSEGKCRFLELDWTDRHLDQDPIELYRFN